MTKEQILMILQMDRQISQNQTTTNAMEKNKKWILFATTTALVMKFLVNERNMRSLIANIVSVMKPNNNCKQIVSQSFLIEQTNALR